MNLPSVSVVPAVLVYSITTLLLLLTSAAAVHSVGRRANLTVYRVILHVMCWYSITRSHRQCLSTSSIIGTTPCVHMQDFYTNIKHLSRQDSEHIYHLKLRVFDPSILLLQSYKGQNYRRNWLRIYNLKLKIEFDY